MLAAVQVDSCYSDSGLCGEDPDHTSLFQLPQTHFFSIAVDEPGPSFADQVDSPVLNIAFPSFTYAFLGFLVLGCGCITAAFLNQKTNFVHCWCACCGVLMLTLAMGAIMLDVTSQRLAGTDAKFRATPTPPSAVVKLYVDTPFNVSEISSGLAHEMFKGGMEVALLGLKTKAHVEHLAASMENRTVKLEFPLILENDQVHELRNLTNLGQSFERGVWSTRASFRNLEAPSLLRLQSLDKRLVTVHNTSIVFPNFDVHFRCQSVGTTSDALKVLEKIAAVRYSDSLALLLNDVAERELAPISGRLAERCNHPSQGVRRFCIGDHLSWVDFVAEAMPREEASRNRLCPLAGNLTRAIRDRARVLAAGARLPSELFANMTCLPVLPQGRC